MAGANSLQWHHASAMTSQITGHSIVCNTENDIKDPPYWPCGGIHQWPVKSPHQGPVMLWRRDIYFSHALWWRHNDHDSVSNHQHHECLLNRSFRRRSKKTSKLRVTGLCVGNSPGPVNSPHKGPVTRKMFPFDDVIMALRLFHNTWRAAQMSFCAVVDSLMMCVKWRIYSSVCVRN